MNLGCEPCLSTFWPATESGEGRDVVRIRFGSRLTRQAQSGHKSQGWPLTVPERTYRLLPQVKCTDGCCAIKKRKPRRPHRTELHTKIRLTIKITCDRAVQSSLARQPRTDGHHFVNS